MIDFDAHEAELTAHVTRRMIELAALEPGAQVLDVGCGRGPIAFACLEAIHPTQSAPGLIHPTQSAPGLIHPTQSAPGLIHPTQSAPGLIDAGGSVLGFDIDARAVAAVNARQVPSVQAVVASAETFTSEHRFDAALARWSLGSVTRPGEALRSIAAVLEPGAPFVVGTWASAAWWSVPRALIERFAPLPPFDVQAPGALRFSAIEGLVDLAAPWFEAELVEQLETAVVQGGPEFLLAWMEQVFARWIALVPGERLSQFRTDALNELRTIRSLHGVTHLVRFRRKTGA